MEEGSFGRLSAGESVAQTRETGRQSLWPVDYLGLAIGRAPLDANSGIRNERLA